MRYKGSQLNEAVCSNRSSGIMDKVAFYSVVIASIYHTDATIQCGTCLQPPNYVSSYVRLNAQSNHSEAIIQLNITEVPIKVDIQVRPISGNDTNFVFPGLGSSQHDDDKLGVYGGVVYKYNEMSVKLYVPNRNDNSGDGTVIFTGYNNTWFGPKVQKEDSAEARVRVWTSCNFPTPDYESNWIHMKVKNGTDSFQEVRHNLGRVPDYVTVQVWNNDTDWYTDGIASGMTPNNLRKETAWGGVVYGVNDTYVRIWVPGYDTGRIFSAADGWGLGSQETWSEGLIKVRVWGHMPGDSVYKSNATIGQSPGMQSSQLGSVARSLNIDTGLVSVMVKALSGENNGFFFPALGAVQNTDPLDKFGGVVYSYSSNGIRIWHPIIPGGGNTLMYSKGTLIYVSPYWGGGVHSQDSKFGLIEVQFWNSYTGKCPPPTTPAKASTSPFTGTGSPTTPRTSGSIGGLTTLSRPVNSVPLLTSSSSVLTTATMTSTKLTGGIAATSTNNRQSSRQVSTVTTFARTTTRGPSSAVSQGIVSGSIRSTTRSTGTRTTSGSRVTGGTGAPNSPTTKHFLTAGSQEEQGDEGLSPVATGLVATASVLSAAGCLGGLIFGLLKKKAKKNRKVDAELEENDAFESQTVDENGKPPSNDGTSPRKDGTHPPDEVSPQKENETTDTGTPPAATDRPQTGRPE